jgi:hypothetical protein
MKSDQGAIGHDAEHLCALCGGDASPGAVIGNGERRCSRCGVRFIPPPTLAEVNEARARLGLPSVQRLPGREHEHSGQSTGDSRWWCACDRGHAAEELRCEACEMARP